MFAYILNEHSFLLTPNDLKNITLIHDLSMEKHQQFPGWQSWLKSVGLNDINISRGMQINSSSSSFTGCNGRTWCCISA